jgi:recombination protein RecT
VKKSGLIFKLMPYTEDTEQTPPRETVTDGPPKILREEDQNMAVAIQAREPDFERAIGKLMPPGKFTRQALTALRKQPALLKCTVKSVVDSLLTIAEVGLSPNPALGQAWLIPYKEKGVDTCQMQFGYKGLAALIYRTSPVASIDASAVYENDHFVYTRGTSPSLEFRKFDGPKEGRGEFRGAYCVISPKGGGAPVVDYIPAWRILEIREGSKAYLYDKKGSIWAKHFDEMAAKTAVRHASKLANIDTRAALYIQADVEREYPEEERRPKFSTQDADFQDVHPDKMPEAAL